MEAGSEGEDEEENAEELTAQDSFIATGPAYGATLPSRAGIVRAVVDLLNS